MRIEHNGEPYVLRNNQIINVGSTLLLVSLMDALDEDSAPALMDVTNQSQRMALSRSGRVPLLKIKVVGGPAYGQFFVRNPLDCSKQHVFGRVDDCDIYVNDQILSKRHCTFQYVAGPSPIADASDLPYTENKEANNRNSYYQGHWVLKDGYTNASLNGTWVYLSQETPIRHKMTFKASEILFEASLH